MQMEWPWVTSNPEGHDIIQRQITQKWYKIELYLQWRSNTETYMVYRTAPFSIILNNPYPRFQGHAILWRWKSHKRYEIQTLCQWNSKGSDTPYSTVNSVISNGLDRPRPTRITTDDVRVFTRWRHVLLIRSMAVMVKVNQHIFYGPGTFGIP